MGKQLEKRNTDSNLLVNIQPVIEGLGYSLVEFSSHRNRANLTINVIIYKPDGINLSDCTTVYKTVLPRVEMLEDSRDVHLEVSSPGISRNIKSIEEFEIFRNRKVKILTHNDSEWIHGIIESVDNNSVEINVEKMPLKVLFSDIKKAKLE